MRALPQLPSTPFTSATACDLGLPRKQLDRLVDERVLRRVLRGVYVRCEIPDTLHTRIAAAALVLRPFVVICDRTAAWVHGVDTFEYHELEILPPLETHALRGHNRSRRAGCHPGVRDLAPQDVMYIDGVPITTPLRTSLDLACKLSARGGLAALDAFMRHHGVTAFEQRTGLVRYFRRRGVVQARRLVPHADPRAESPGESWVRWEIIDHGLPTPELQWWVRDEFGRLRYRVDLAYPKHRIAVEFDGREFHSKPEQRALDRQRRKWLRDRGWTVIVVTKDDLGLEAVDGWIGEIREALRQRVRTAG
jgi:hypothetical protein